MKYESGKCKEKNDVAILKYLTGKTGAKNTKCSKGGKAEKKQEEEKQNNVEAQRDTLRLKHI